jgi:Ca-activated chloride channel homolog
MTEAAKNVTMKSAECAPQRGLGLFESKDGIADRLPLAEVDISAAVLDSIASVTVTQKFANKLSEPIEAVYIFPLSGSSCVSACELIIGDRVINAVVKERGAARVEYQEALQEGRRAALVEQERDNVFTMQVGNVMPGEAVKVKITYSELLTCFEDGFTELRLPLVVAPKYITGNSLNRNSVGDGVELDTDIVPDASRITPPVLSAGLNPGVDLNIEVLLEIPEPDSLDLEAASMDLADVADLTCSQHATRTSYGKSGLRITLAKTELMNRDFVLNWKGARSTVKSSAYISKEASEIEGQFFHYGLLSVKPPLSGGTQATPRDVIFLLDRSGSMSGIKMASAARALTFLLNTLGPNDSFAICAFDDMVEWPCDRVGTKIRQTTFLRATPAGIEKGSRVLRNINARGGTEIGRALVAAYDAFKQRRKQKHNASDPSHSSGSTQSVETSTSGSAQSAGNLNSSLRREEVLVLITDGQVGEAGSAFKTVQDNAPDVRLFTVGIDTAVNDAFLERSAKLGGGTCALVTPGDQLNNALRQISREIGTPLISELTIVRGDGIKLVTQTPSCDLDLFEGRPVSIFFQCTDEAAEGSLLVEGKYADGTVYSETVILQKSDNAALPQLFARSQVVELEDEMRLNPSQANVLRDEIVALAVCHRILTRFTAFVAVDMAEVANKSGQDPRKLVQPVLNPQDWELQASQAALAAGFGAPCPPCAPGQNVQNQPGYAASWGASAGQWGTALGGIGGTGGTSDAADSWGTPAASGWGAPSQPPAPRQGGGSYDANGTRFKQAPGVPPSAAPSAGALFSADSREKIMRKLSEASTAGDVDSLAESLRLAFEAESSSGQPVSGASGGGSELEEIARAVILLARFKEALTRIVKRSGVLLPEEPAQIREFARLIRDKIAKLGGHNMVSLHEFDRDLQTVLDACDQLSGPDPTMIACEVCIMCINVLRQELLDRLALVGHPQAVGSDPFWFGNV